MKEIGYEYENQNNYLTICADKNSQDRYQIKMLANNTINCLLPFHAQSINNHTYYYYNITSKKSLKQLCEVKKIQWEDIVRICRGVEQLCFAINEYMLNLNCVLLKPELVYCNMTLEKLFFLYNPDNQGDFREELKGLFEYILEKFEHGKDKRQLIFVYDLYQKIVDGECDFFHMTQQLESVAKENDTEVKREVVIEEVIPEEIESEVEIPAVKNKSIYKAGIAFIVSMLVFFAASFLFYDKFFVKLPVIVSVVGMILCVYALVKLLMYLKKSENLGEIVEVTQKEKYSFTPEENSMENFSQKETAHEHENTVLLSDYVRLNENKELKLVPVTRSGMCDAQREVIVVKEFPWVIGSMKNYCNTVLDDDLVSRIHLSIYRENEEYYIEDMNSTNGTFLNDERLQPQSRCKLKAQDCITIADRSYRVEKELPLF